MAIYSQDGTVLYTAQEMERHHPWCILYHSERKGCHICEHYYLKHPVQADDPFCIKMWEGTFGDF